ncbi:MAG TPA: M20/M25/M40 family metallo-hydrolase [Steroidobacteraceae bacterium]|jgi:glutamate carboxypeptidase|nr:M20/M25/M40 family metallo-hydrolase [Steroidobacteraceae bacterium]
MHSRSPAAALAAIAPVLCLLCAEPSAAAAKLSSAEQRLVAAAAAENARAIELLETLVNVNSGTMNVAGVTRVGEIMRKEFESLGFDVRWVSMESVGRAGHLIAEHKGSGRGKRMLLIGHLDTVFEKDSPFQKFERRGDIAEGPGVNDMKDGLAIMVSALRAMKNTGALQPATIAVVLSGDEESPGRPFSISRADMRNAASRSDVALEFEALAREDGHDMGSIARRSSNTWTVRTSAKSGHSSGVFSEDAGFGAAYELTRILDAFRLNLREPNATYNIGLMLGGATAELNEAGTGGHATGKGNVIPAAAIARGDLRTLSNEQTQRIQQRMREIVAQHLPGTQAEFTFEEGYPAMPPTAASRALLAELNEINAALGLEEMRELDPLKRGAGDIAFVADQVSAGLIGFGAAGQGSHAPGETVDLTSFDRQIKRVALLMARLAHTRR